MNHRASHTVALYVVTETLPQWQSMILFHRSWRGSLHQLHNKLTNSIAHASFNSSPLLKRLTIWSTQMANWDKRYQNKKTFFMQLKKRLLIWTNISHKWRIWSKKWKVSSKRWRSTIVQRHLSSPMMTKLSMAETMKRKTASYNQSPSEPQKSHSTWLRVPSSAIFKNSQWARS